jgi:uncharacterized protein YcbX
MPALSQLFVYPVKSLGGISVSEWPVDGNGLRFDRKWMIVDSAGKFLSQRRLPKMALIRTCIDGDRLILSTAARDNLVLELYPRGGDDMAVEIWHDRCVARSVSPAADAWLSDVLQTDCRLVYHPNDRQRLVDQNYALPNDHTAFSDGFPFLILSDGSLKALNQALDIPVSISRFRPNIVLTGCDAYAEDYWRSIQINSIKFRLPKPCSRCSIPAIDPDTGEVGKEPLTTLSRLRKWGNNIYFGQNALHDNQGTLKIGDSVTVLAEDERQPPLN